MKAADHRPYWTRQAAAERIGVSVSSVDRLAAEGLLRKVKLPGFAHRVVVSAESIDAYEARIVEQERRLAIVEGAVA